VGQLADLSVFSFHPVKAMTTGEGGVITTGNFETSQRMRRFRNHGISSDHFTREQQGSWLYEMVDLGYNYRLSDFQCALGLSQLGRLTGWIARRRAIAQRYDRAFAELAGVVTPSAKPDREHAYHLYVIRLDRRFVGADRATIFAALRAEGIGVNVHYLPVYLHSFYRARFGTQPGLCPRAEAAYEEILSLPLFPSMAENDIRDVIDALWKVITRYASQRPASAAAGLR
jgi:perosamine synthetase